MAKFKFKPTINVAGYFSAKLKGAITDNDVGKPVKLSSDTTDTFELCSDGDAIDAFIVAVDPATADGLVFATLNNGGLIRCEASGAMNVGELIEAGAVAAAGTAETNGLPLISTKAAIAADLAIDASGTLIAASVNALLAEMLLPTSAWQVVSANTADGVVTTGDTTVVIKRV